MSSLRALVRAILLEDDETLKKWALADGDPIEKALAAKGIIPIHRGQDQTSELGSGQHNVVLDVVYQGKRAVARIASEMNEVDQLMDFVHHAKQMHTKYHKHFPRVFKVFDLEVESKHNIEYYYGAVVEMLDPMPPGLEFDLDSHALDDNLQGSRVAAVMKDNWIIDGVIGDASQLKTIRADLLHMYETDIRPRLQSFVNGAINDVDEYVVNCVEKYAKQASLKNRIDFRTALVPYYAFSKGLMAVLRNAVIPIEPTSSQGGSRVPDSHASRHVREFYEFLQELQGAGMAWADLHTGNFMMRRGTGDFVIVDPGYFDSSDGSISSNRGSDQDPPSGS